MSRICKVLIVEDHDDVRELLGAMFEHEGFDFAAVETGAQMRAALDEDDYDITIIDVLLPGGEDGFALAETARELGCGVILITGDHRHIERLEQSGHYHLLKPFPLQDMIALIERVLTETANLCTRRKRGDGSGFPARPG
jgi:two-component system OmpR family response regulator